MNVKEITTMITSVIVAIIVTVTVLVPIVGTAIDDQHEYYNNSIGQYSKVVDEPVVLEYTYDSDSGAISYTVDGVDQSLLFDYNDTIFATSHASLKITNASNYSSYIIWLDESGESNRIDSPKSVSVEMDADSVSATFVKAGGDTASFEVGIDWGFYAVTDGDYRSVWAPYNVYINDVNQVYSVNWLSTTTEFFSIHGESAIYGGGDATVSYDLTPMAGVIDVYNLTSGDLKITVDNNGTPYAGEPFIVIVPVEVIGDKGTYSDVLDTILVVLPIFVVMGLLVGIAFYFKRT